MLAVIPGEDKRDRKARGDSHDEAANDDGWPPEVVTHKPQNFEHDPATRQVGERPLDNLTLLQSLKQRCQNALPSSSNWIKLSITC